MTKYKKQIEAALIKGEWEIILIDRIDDWWIEEFWRIKSKKLVYDLEFFLVFEVDPMSLDNNSPEVNNVGAYSQFPLNRLDKSYSIGVLDMKKGPFDIRLNDFIQCMESYRKSFNRVK